MTTIWPQKLRAALGMIVLLALIGGCDDAGPTRYYGYVEGEYVRVAAPLAGRLTTLYVQRGDSVQPDTPLFVLEHQYEVAARREAMERLNRAEALLADLQKGRRPPEVDVIEAQLGQAQSDLKLSKTRLARQQQLANEGVVARDALDAAQTTYQRDLGRVEELKAQLTVAGLAGREDQIAAAAREVEAERAALAQAEWTLEQKSAKSTNTGLVTDTLYVEGEWVPAGSPVVVVLPKENIKLRFFVPQTDLGALAVGDTVAVGCDGCAAPIAARISFISPQAEYTPPVIYSTESRAKLVYLVEARPAPQDAMLLHPGQPVDVRPSGKP